MWIKEIWRYPVKSMAGELLATAELTPSGIHGDRILQVRSPVGRVVTARTRPLLLRHRAELNEGEIPLVDGLPWTSSEIARRVEAAAGPGARLTESGAGDRFDILPLLIATDGMLEAVGYDRRRFRPNIVIGGVTGLDEKNWEGAQLRLGGGAVIGMHDLRGRCIMTTYDPDSGEQDLNVLRKVQREFGGALGLNTEVLRPGRISVGDPVELLAHASRHRI